jgi:hypothetical protein
MLVAIVFLTIFWAHERIFYLVSQVRTDYGAFVVPLMLLFVGMASQKALEESPAAGKKTVAVIELTGMITSQDI